MNLNCRLRRNQEVINKLDGKNWGNYPDQHREAMRWKK